MELTKHEATLQNQLHAGPKEGKGRWYIPLEMKYDPWPEVRVDRQNISWRPVLLMYIIINCSVRHVTPRRKEVNQ